MTKILYILLSLTLLVFNTMISHHDNFLNYVSILHIKHNPDPKMQSYMCVTLTRMRVNYVCVSQRKDFPIFDL